MLNLYLNKNFTERNMQLLRVFFIEIITNDKSPFLKATIVAILKDDYLLSCDVFPMHKSFR